MHPQTILAKTSKGVLDIRNKNVKLPRDQTTIFLAIDGKSTLADLAEKLRVPAKQLEPLFEKLVAEGYIKVFSVPAEQTARTAAPVIEEGFDLDFTSPEVVAQLRTILARQPEAIPPGGSPKR